MSNQLLKKIADELKEARKKKKITIDQIFTKTRIDKKYLTAIEEGNFTIMPNVYIRAFIKEYSINVGLNPTEVLERFTLAQKGIDFEETKSPKENPETGKTLIGKKKNVLDEKAVAEQNDAIKDESTNSVTKFNKLYYYGVVAVLMLVFILVIYKLFLTETNNEIITEKPFETIVESKNKISAAEENIKIEKKQTPTDFGEIDPKKVELIKPETKQNQTTSILPNENKLISQNALTLTIVSSDKSWIRVESDDKNVMEFTIEEGVTKVLNADDRFYLHIGNSGGIKLLLNDKDLFFSGSPGKVRKIFVTKNGIEYLRRTPVINAE